MHLNLSPMLAELNFMQGGIIIIAAVVIVIVVFLLLYMVFSRYTKVGPNQVLVVSGIKHREQDGTKVGFRIVKGGGTFVWPIFEKVDILSLELLTIDVQTPEVYTSKGVPVKVDGVAQTKVKGDDVSIRTAAEQFLGKSTDEIRNIATQTLEGHLRAILGTMTVEEIYQNRDAFAQKVQEVAAGDMANMGLNIISFTIRDIRDGQGYLDALGKPRIAQVKRDAIIAQAEADRDSQIRSAQAKQAGQEAQFAADTKIAEAQRDYQSNVAQYQATVNQQKAQADLAYDLQKFKTGQLVKAEEVQVSIIEKQKQIELQQQEILRKQRELEATVQKPADAERYKVETLANAKKFQLETEAAGAASATKATGFAGAQPRMNWLKPWNNDAGGFYLTTLSTVDVSTGWYEPVGVWGKGQERVGGAVHHVKEQLPMPLLGLDSDNGSEFINRSLYDYCRRWHITSPGTALTRESTVATWNRRTGRSQANDSLRPL